MPIGNVRYVGIMLDAKSFHQQCKSTGQSTLKIAANSGRLLDSRLGTVEKRTSERHVGVAHLKGGLIYEMNSDADYDDSCDNYDHGDDYDDIMIVMVIMMIMVIIMMIILKMIMKMMTRMMTMMTMTTVMMMMTMMTVMMMMMMMMMMIMMMRKYI